MNGPTASPAIRILTVLSLAFAVALTSGCGGGGKSGKDQVSGKVTMGGNAVSGEITFIGSDGKEVKSPLAPDGGYQIIGLPKGKAEILITKGLASGGAPVPKGAGEMPGMPAAGGGTLPPASYAKKGNGLSVDVTGGDQKHDITLNP